MDAETLDAVVRAYRLKDERRTGWEVRDVDEPESVAAHAWGVAVLAWLFCPPSLDRERVMALALLHDLPEAETGDIPRRDADGEPPMERAEKRRREEAAIAGPLSPLDDAVAERWHEYEDGTTPEAAFVHDLDHLDACLQAAIYRDRGHDERMQEFFETAERELRTDRGRELFESIRSSFRDGTKPPG